MTSISSRPLVGLTVSESRAKAPSRSAVSPITWTIVTCLLIALSGGVRFWRDYEFSALAVQSAACPFPMSDIPESLGSWQTVAGTDTQLDPEIVRVAGATDHIVRSYLDRKTGEQASVLALYGLGVDVYGHVPEVCYVTGGYTLFKGPIDCSMKVSGLKIPVRYRWSIFTKQVGGLRKYVEVFHAFFHDGEWLPDASDRWKQFRSSPGLYKIQIEHNIAAFNQDGEGPCQGLVKELARVITLRATAASASTREEGWRTASQAINAERSAIDDRRTPRRHQG